MVIDPITINISNDIAFFLPFNKILVKNSIFLSFLLSNNPISMFKNC